MKSNYTERKEARIEAYRRLADKNKDLSNQAYQSAKNIGDMIPMGQPILVGHHSEARHRRDIARIDNNMRKSVEADAKAEYYADKAEAAETSTAISSDDPEAIAKLREKLAGLEKAQELYKAINKIIGKKTSDIEKVELLVNLGISETKAMELLAGDFMGRKGIPSYKLRNNNANIRTTRQRLEHLEKVSQLTEQEVIINGATLRLSPADNRVQIFFPDKPTEEVRKALKSRGFRWAPSVGAWMRQISNNAVWSAKNILRSEAYLKTLG